MRKEDTTAQVICPAVVRCFSAEIKFRIYYRSLPLADISCVMEVKRCCQRLQQIGRRALIAVTKTNREREFIARLEINFAGQRNISVFSGAEFPCHFEMVHHVLPTVAYAPARSARS